MKKARMYCFSGTGNTELVARMVADGLSRRGYELEFLRIEDELKAGRAPRGEGADLLGIACPVIGYGVPLVVRRFLGRFPRSPGTKAFILRTAGGVVPANYNASAPIRAALERRGCEVFHERLFSIGSNWIVRFGTGAMRALRDGARAKAELMCDELSAGTSRMLGRRRAARAALHGRLPRRSRSLGRATARREERFRCIIRQSWITIAPPPPIPNPHPPSPSRILARRPSAP